MLEINRKNILGWLSLIRDIYPLTDDERKKINKFIKTRYTIRREKLLDEIFKED
jgi:hypothetical protein